MYTMLVLMLLLFHKGRKHARSLILALYALIEVVTNGMISLNMATSWEYFEKFPFTHFIYKPFYCLWAPFFYFYFRSCFSSDFRIRKNHWLHFLPFVGYLIFFLVIWLVNGNHYIRENLYKADSFLNYADFSVDIVVKLQYLIYNILMIRSLWRLESTWKNQNELKVEPAVGISWFRFVVYGYAIGCLLSIVTFFFTVVGSPSAAVVNMVSVSYFFLFFFMIFYNTITHRLFEEEIKTKVNHSPNDEMQKLMSKIEEQVVEKKMFLEHELSLQQIALALNEKERNISQAINSVEKRNVNDYINTLRIKHACHLLLSNKEKPVFEIMYESGFSTKGAFNLAFKKITGKTPTQFREE
jgi:AraC-like DNA-binding protein